MASELEDDTFSGRFDLQLWKKILAFARPHLRKIVAIIIFGVIIAGLDILLPYFGGRLVDAARDASTSGARSAFIGYAVVVVVFVVFIWAFIRATGRITCDISYDLRVATFAHLQKLSFSFYDKKAVGWLMARLTGDVSTLSRVMSWAILDIVWGTACIVLVAAAMLYSNWKLALLVMLIVPPLCLSAMWFQKRMLESSRALRKVNSQVTATYNESLQAVRTTRSMNRETQNLAEFSTLAGTMYGHAMRNSLLNALFVPLLSSICLVGVAIALHRGGYDVARGSGFTLGELVAFIQWATFLQWPVMQLAQQITQVQSAQASAERIQSLLDTQPDIQDRPGTLAEQVPDSIRQITFENVTFGYDPDRPVLHGFSLTVHAGQSVAIVGPTGGGKSTIVSLACRFYQPTSGRILINGIDYTTLPLHWLQSRLGMVLQQPHLFSGTVRDNIRYGRLEATDADVEHAAILAGAHGFITQLTGGYDAKVGEGGNRLSTGQKQLISLARAILANPQIFVMDEATSSVDTQTERAIQSALDQALKGRIGFVIAHRLSTIKRADIILVVSGGRVVEQGNHHDLLALRGKYFELYTNQFTHEHEDELLHIEHKDPSDTQPPPAP